MNLKQQINLLFLIINKQIKRKLSFVLLIMFISMILEMAGIGLILPLLQVLLDYDGLINFFSKHNITAGFVEFERQKLLIFFITIIFIFFLIKGLFMLFALWYQMRFAYGVQKFISKRIFNKYLNQGLLFHVNNNPSKLSQIITLEANYLVGDFLIPFMVILTEALILIGISALLIIYDPAVFFLVIIFYSLTMYLYIKITKKKNIELGEKRHFFEKKRALDLQNSFFAFKDIKIFLSDIFFSKSLFKNIEKLADVATLQQTLQYIPSRVIEIISIFTFTLVIIFMIFSGYDPNKMIITLGILTAGAFKIMPSFNRIISSYQSMRFSKISVEKISDLIKLKDYQFPNYYNPEFNKKISSIRLENLNFRFEETSEFIFKDLNLEIKKNEFIGIVGKSGSGKSTLINIILGLIKPTQGEVKYIFEENEDLKISQKKVFAYIPQEFQLIDDTLISNIAFGVDPNDIDLKNIEFCLNAVQMRDFYEKIKLNKNFIIKDRGLNLSGGQRQRLAIARALYFDPQILIFDEATSSLDKLTEQYITDFINTMVGKKIIILSTHKEYQLQNCDKVYEVKHNKLLNKI
tara:strand:- start:17499 stop:19232 length:1734 start_codon:yes stop_codon:yes gene_type:complete